MRESTRGRSVDVEFSFLSPAQTRESEQIAALWETAWKADPSPAELLQAARKLEKEIQEIDPTRKALIVARTGAKVVGFCRVARDREHESQWWVMGLAVCQDLQRQGIGTTLLRAGIDYARNSGAKIVRSTTDPWNRASIRCHENAGFENRAQFVAEDGDDKVAFRLEPDSDP